MKKNIIFNLFIVDHDRKIFNIIENLTDDEYYTEKIAEIQKTGRDIRCSSNNEPKQQALEQYEEMGFKYTTDEIL